MRTVIVAAGAAVIGSAVASSHVKNMHQKLHARDTDTVVWEEWSTSSAPVDPTSTTSTWDWTTSSKPAVATSETTSSTWDWTTSSKPAVATSTTTSSSTWDDWESTTTSKKADPTSTSSWADWESTSTTTSKKADPTTTGTVTWEDWSSTKVDPTSSTTSSWADWDPTTPVVATTTSSWADWDPTTPVVATTTSPATSTESWADWSDESVVVTTIHTTTTKTIWLGVKSSTAAASSWVDWSSANSSTPVVATSSVPTGWFGAPWPTTDACVKQIFTSYGAATWYPTPSTVTVTVTPVASSWADWSSTTTTTKAKATTTSTDSWADWSSTSSTPVVVTKTSSTSAIWADWSSTSTKPVATSTTTAGWGGAFYGASTTASSGWPSSSSSSSSGSGSLKSNGNYFGMTYSPYTNEGGCKDAGTVAADIAKIASKGFTTVRVYSTDCNTLDNVGTAAKNSGLKIILGVFISSTGISGAAQQVTDIAAWAQWDLVELIVVGNEAVFNGYCSASELAGFIGSSKWTFQAAGYKGGITTTEPLTTWETTGTTFCSVIDVVAANLYAFFNAQTTADKAGDLIQAQIGILNGVCAGKDSYVMESGWPSAGNCNGVACPSPENQATALKSIQAVSGSKIVFFSFEDEAWKAPGEFNVEQHWGCANVF